MKHRTQSRAPAVVRLSRWLWQNPGLLGASAAALSAAGLLGSAAFLGKHSDHQLQMGLLVYLALGTVGVLYHLDLQRH
ncbi:MAG TPA: hypothetical protein VFH51_14440 [Myxococcota bacterium]|nr:hypothetical protein [Myxococcota bacterium]